MRRSAVGFGMILAVAAAAGCALGPRALDTGRLQYNEAIKSTSDEQLLLNIVRLRYTDTPSSLAVSSIADQRELSAGLQATPFFTSDAGGLSLGGYRGGVLPGGQVTAANRPTLSYTPLDDSEFSRRLFTPIALEGVSYLSKTTWPISTVFRLYLENLNWVSNAETASGPTPRDPPEFAEFLAGIRALQRLQDQKLITFFVQDRDEKQSDGVPADRVTAAVLVDAAKHGLEYRKGDDGTWSVVKKKQVPTLRVAPAAVGNPDFHEFCRAFKLDPAATTFELGTDSVDPFLVGAPPAGLRTIDLETRSLLQVLFFVANGVAVPPEHLASGLAPVTANGDGTAFDYDQVLGGLFKVCWACGKKPPATATVAVRYRGYWFYIDAGDRDTRATFALLAEMSRLELGSKERVAPLLTLPVGQ